MARRINLAPVAAAALAALMLTSCSEPAAPAAGSAEGPAAVKLKVLFASGLNNVPMMVAAENGYWRDRGLDVTVKVLDSGSEIAQALVTGAADIGAGNATSSIPLSRAAGNELVMVGAYHNNPLVAAGTERVGIVAASDSGIVEGKAQSLVGKSVGVAQGSTSENYLKSYLAANGLSLGDIKPVNLAVPDMPTALSQGNVDAVVPWEPQVSEILRTEGDDATVVVRGGPYGASVVGVMVTDRYLAANAAVLERYVLGAWEGDKFTREHPAEAAAIAQRYISGLNLEDATSGIELMATEFDPRISPCTETAVTGEQENLIAAHSMDLPGPLPYDEVVASTFIQELLDDNPDLVADLPPLPADAAACK